MSILQRFPNYAAAKGFDEFDASEISEQTFFDNYVKRNKPVVIRNAAQHWPMHQWDTQQLKDALAQNETFKQESYGLKEAVQEYAGKYPGEKARAAFINSERLEIDTMFSRLTSDEELKITAHFDDTLVELGMKPLSFCPNALKRQSLFYKNRIFLHSGGYTDWHFHYTDDTIAVQLYAKKEFMFLPTDKNTFRRMWDISKDRGFWNTELNDFPELQSLTPYKVTLNPGDGVYIPVWWWHAAEACNMDLGATTALAFKSPASVQFDPRFAALRWNLKTILTKRRSMWKIVPPILLGAVYSLLRHPVNPPYLYSGARSE